MEVIGEVLKLNKKSRAIYPTNSFWYSQGMDPTNFLSDRTIYQNAISANIIPMIVESNPNPKFLKIL